MMPNPEEPSAVPEDVAGVYGPRHLLEYYIRGHRFFRYELLDG